MTVTIRQELTQKKRKIMLIGYSGLAFTIVGVILSDKSNGLPLIPLLGLPVFVVCILLVTQTLRCPRCSGNLGQATLAYGSPFSISKAIRYCPFCKADLDADNDRHNPVHDDGHTTAIKIKLFKRLFILQLIVLSLMFSVFTVAFFQKPMERLDMFAFSSSFFIFLLCQYYMAYYLGIKGQIEYDMEINRPSLKIALTYRRFTTNTPRKNVFIVYIAAFLGLVLSGIIMFSMSSPR